MHRYTERLRTWKIEWLGACRKCSLFDGATRWSNSRTVNEYGYLWKTSASGVANSFFCIWAASYRFYRRSLPKRSRVPFRVLVRSVGCSVCDCFSLWLPIAASFCGRLQFNHLDQQQTQRTKTKGELRSSVTRRSSPIETETIERVIEADTYYIVALMMLLLLMLLSLMLLMVVASNSNRRWWLDGCALHKNSTPDVGCYYFM